MTAWRRRMSWTLLVGMTIGGTGCVGAVPEAHNVRIVKDARFVEGCTFVKVVEGSSHWGGFAAQGVAHDNALTEIRNAAAAVGANRVLLTIDRVGFSGARMLGDAFACVQ